MNPSELNRPTDGAGLLRVGKRTVAVAIGVATSIILVALLQHPAAAAWVARRGWVGVGAALFLAAAALAPWGAMLASQVHRHAARR